MNQVGHRDSKVTLEVYAQLQQRNKRDHGAAFDRLIEDARERLHRTNPAAPAEFSPADPQPAQTNEQEPVETTPAPLSETRLFPGISCCGPGYGPGRTRTCDLPIMSHVGAGSPDAIRAAAANRRPTPPGAPADFSGRVETAGRIRTRSLWARSARRRTRSTRCGRSIVR